MKIKLSYEQIQDLASNKDPFAIAQENDFWSAIKIADAIMSNMDAYTDFAEYAASILEGVRLQHPDEWNARWKYDLYLGFVYDMACDGDKTFEAYKRALSRASQPYAPILLIGLAGCRFYRIAETCLSDEEAIQLLLAAIKDIPYYSAVVQLRAIYREMGDVEREKYYDELLQKPECQNAHLPSWDEIMNFPE